jgi:hypothetical protein
MVKWMRCPRCGRFSKEVKVLDESGRWVVYSDCVNCGRVSLDEEEIPEWPEFEKKTDFVKVFLALFLVISVGMTGFLYYRMTQYELVIEDFQVKYLDLLSNYQSVLNTSSSLELYYDELQEMYSVLREEYSVLEGMYSELLREKVALQREFDEIMGFNRSILLENNRTIELSAGGNVTLSYEIIYAGYIELNFTSSVDIFFWVGSSVTENDYYARYPPFPETVSNGTFAVPAHGGLFIFIKNPSEDASAIVALTVKYVY